MIVKTCTRCKERQKEPLCWTVAVWIRADGKRVAYKHKLCLTCISAKLAPLQVHSDQSLMTCPGCGMSTENDYDAVYVNWIPRGVGLLQAESPFCDVHAAEFRIWFLEGAEEMEDRGIPSGGKDLAPRYSASETLAALGITPRA